MLLNSEVVAKGFGTISFAELLGFSLKGTHGQSLEFAIVWPAVLVYCLNFFCMPY